MSTVYLGLGSNLGDRQSNILHALQSLRRELKIDAVSDYYEGPPALGAAGPAYLNVAVQARTPLEPPALAAFLRDVELAVGRRSRTPLGARPIDVDILLIDGVHADFGEFAVPHANLAGRPFNVVPLAQIAPDAIEPVSGRRIAELAERSGRDGLVRLARSLHFKANRQDEAPAVRLGIDRVGVANLARAVRLRIDGREATLGAEFTMSADLAPERAGLHLSRFAESLEATALEVLAGPHPHDDAAALAAAIALRIVASQQVTRADVRLCARFALERWTPVSGKRGEETYTLVAVAHAEGGIARHVVGVEAEGMTACPCAQAMVREHSLRELRGAGFNEADANRALDALPVATHNQRGRGAVFVGIPPDCEVRVGTSDLVEIVENAMSSETYDLLKRPDEFFVVNKAHRNPKFVEDVVRGTLLGTLDMYADLPDAAFILASQINYESIHKHDATAEAFGTFGELRAELRTATPRERRTDLATWLGTRPSAVTASLVTPSAG